MERYNLIINESLISHSWIDKFKDCAVDNDHDTLM